MANLLLSVMGAFAQFKRELIRERQREGIELAKRAGGVHGATVGADVGTDRRPLQTLGSWEGKSALAREFEVDRRTIYRYEARGAQPKVQAVRVRGGKVLTVDNLSFNIEAVDRTAIYAHFCESGASSCARQVYPISQSSDRIRSTRPRSAHLYERV